MIVAAALWWWWWCIAGTRDEKAKALNIGDALRYCTVYRLILSTIISCQFPTIISPFLGYHGRQSDWSWAGRPVGRSSRPVTGRIFLSISSRPGRGAHSVQWVPRVKWPGLEADHSSGAEVKNTWMYTSALPYVFVT
jgi:hypothetical protein